MTPEQMAMLMLFSGGVPKTGDVNASQDLLFDFLLSPEFGILTGTYDPYLTVDQGGGVAPPEIGMPITMGYASGQGTMASIAGRMLAGDLNYASALQELTRKQGEAGSDVYGLDLASEVSKIRDEINDYTQRAAQGGGTSRDNFYAKAGLPTPDRQWSIQDMPQSEALQSQLSELAAMETALAADEEKFASKPMKTRQVEAAGRRGSPSARGVGGGTIEEPDDRSRFRRGVDALVVEPLSPAVSGAGEVLGTGFGAIGDVLWSPIHWGSKGVRYLAANPDAEPSEAEQKQMWEMVDPEWIKEKQALADRRADLGRRRSKSEADRVAELGMLRMIGSTPYADAMRERTNALAMLRQFSGM